MNSLFFVHNTEGEGKASSDFLKVLVGDEAILVMVIVFKHRLGDKQDASIIMTVKSEPMEGIKCYVLEPYTEVEKYSCGHCIS